MRPSVFFVLSFFLFTLPLSSTTYCQGPPPAMAMPSDNNRLLIDSIISVTNHEKYFTDYCTKHILAYAKENTWSPEKTNEITNSIKFKYYSSTIYNAYANYSTSQLKTLLDAMTLMSETTDKWQNFILTNDMMQSNLDLHVSSLIQGKYVTTKVDKGK